MLEPGKRKLIAALVFSFGYFVTSSGMLLLDKISGAEYVEGLGITSYVVMAFIGVNAVNAAVKQFGKKDDPNSS